MANAAELVLLIKGDTSSAEKGVGGLLGMLGKIGLGAMGFEAIAGAARGAADTVMGLVASAEGLADSQARVDLVYGASSKAVTDWAAKEAAAYGYSKQAALDAAGGLGQYLENMGLGQGVASGMSTELVGLAAKMAAANGTTKEQAFSALEKGLGGATRGLKEYGVSIEGLPKGLSKAAQAQAIYEQVLKQTKNAQDLWADNSKDVAVSMERVSASVDNAKAALGDKLLPILAPLAEKFAGVLPGAIDTAMRAVDGVMGHFQPIIDGISKIDFGAAFQSLTSGDIAGAAESMATDIQKAFGIQIDTGWITSLQTAAEAGKTKLDEIVAAAQPWIDKLNQILPPGQLVAAMIGVALVGAFGALAIAAGSAALGVITALAPILIPIALVGAAVVLLKNAWESNWGDIQGKTAGVIDWFNANVVPTIQSVVDGAKNAWAGLVAFWEQNKEQIIGVLQGLWQTVSGLFDAGLAIVKGIITAGLALIRGDWKGAWDALVEMVKGVGAGVGRALAGLWTVITNVGAMALTKAKEIGTKIIDGVKGAIEDGKQRLVTAITGAVSGLIDAAKSALGIKSPSKVFEMMAFWIHAGLAAGLDKYDFKSIEAMQKVVQAITSIAGAIPDFFSKMKGLVIPDDAALAQMDDQFKKALTIMEHFVRGLSDRALRLGVGVGGFFPEELKKQLKDKGIDWTSLLNQNEVSNVSSLLDIVSKVASTWGAVSKAMTDIASTKIPDMGILDQIKLFTDRMVIFTQESAKNLNLDAEMGAWADSVVAMVKGVSEVGKMDLSGFKRLGGSQLDDAFAGIQDLMRRMATLSSSLVKGPGYDLTAAPDKAKADLAVVQALMSTLAGEADAIFKTSGLGAALADAKRVTESQIAQTRETMLLLSGLASSMIKGPGYDLTKDIERSKGALDITKTLFDTIGSMIKPVIDAAGLGKALEGATRVTAESLAIAGDNARDAWHQAVLLAADLIAMGDAAKPYADAVREWISGAGAASDLFGKTAEATAKINEASAVSSMRLAFARTTITRIVEATLGIRDDLVTNLGLTLEGAVLLGQWADAIGKEVDLFAKVGGLTVKWDEIVPISIMRLSFIRANMSKIADTARGIRDDLAASGFTVELLTEMSKWSDAWGKIVDGFVRAVMPTVDLATATAAPLKDGLIDQARTNILAIITGMQDIGASFTADQLTGIGLAADAASKGASLIVSLGESIKKMVSSNPIPDDVLASATDNSKRILLALNALALDPEITADVLKNASAISASVKPAVEAVQAALKPLSDFLSGPLFLLKDSDINRVAERSVNAATSAIRLMVTGLGLAAKDLGPDLIKQASDLGVMLKPVEEALQASLGTITDFMKSKLVKSPSAREQNAIALGIKAAVSAMIKGLQGIVVPPNLAAGLDPLIDTYKKLFDLFDAIAKVAVPDAAKIAAISTAAGLLIAALPAGGVGAPGTGTYGTRASTYGAPGATTSRATGEPKTVGGTVQIDKLTIDNKVMVDGKVMGELITTRSFIDAVKLHYALLPGAS